MHSGFCEFGYRSFRRKEQPNKSQKIIPAIRKELLDVLLSAVLRVCNFNLPAQSSVLPFRFTKLPNE